MSKLLYITVNPKHGPERSKGAQIGEAFLTAFKEEKPDIEIDHMHLYDMDIPEIDEDMLYARAKISFMGYTFDRLSEAEQKQLTNMHALADRFIDADYYVFVTPLWNLGSPSILKKFMDNLFIVHKTFENTPEGPKGLLTGRKAIHIQTRGGVYSTGPMIDFEFGDRYLTKALGFLGLEVMDTIAAEGLDHFPKMIPEIMEKAKAQASAAAREMAKSPVSV